MRDRKSIHGGAGNLTKLSDFLCLDARIQSASDDDDGHNTTPTAADSPGYCSDHLCNRATDEGSPYNMSPWNPSSASPYTKSPWLHATAAVSPFPSDLPPNATLLASLVRSEGHVYSLAAAGDLLYTGSESKNIRVWKRWREFAGFKSGSGFVKAIVIADGRVFTGHQDGKIRVWRASASDPSVHRRVGTLPRLGDYLKSSINPSSYVQARRHRNAVWLRHFDAVSCLSLDEEGGVLYSGSWDRTVKVWRIADSKCLESIAGHDDAVNSVAAAPGGVVFTGSADGTVKMWRREAVGRHAAVQTLLEQESAVTALAVGGGGEVLYCGSSDGAVNWWEIGRRMARGGELRGHRMAVLCLAATGRVVVSGSADKTLCVWRRDAAAGGAEHVRLAVLAGHGGPVKCLAVEEDSAGAGAVDGEGPWLVYSGSLDKSVRVWRVSGRVDETFRASLSSGHVISPPMHVRGAAGGKGGAQVGHGMGIDTWLQQGRGPA